MTPKEKAEELVNQFIPYAMIGYKDEGEYEKHNAKQCALIAVDEQIKSVDLIKDSIRYTYRIFWQEVKQEIEKL